MELEDDEDIIRAAGMDENDSVQSKGLYQVTEKNSENASVKVVSRLEYNMISLLELDAHS